jgi:Ca2+/Na+ antiporter
MKVLGSAVLTMEFFIMGFAMLIAKDNHEPSTIIYGAVFMVSTIFTMRLLKTRTGWILGSLLQAMLMGYSVVVPSMAIVNVIFVGLWIAAYVVGKKGEAARAALLAKGGPNS